MQFIQMLEVEHVLILQGYRSLYNIVKSYRKISQLPTGDTNKNLQPFI